MLALDLAKVLDPITTRTFWAKHWERAPLLVNRRDPEHFDGLLSLADVDEILLNTSLRNSTARILQAGTKLEVLSLFHRSINASTAALEAFYDEFRRGGSFTIQALPERWEPARELCRALADELSAELSINVYVSPPKGVALPPHFDTHDVFVLQVAGHKQWKIHGHAKQLPFESEQQEGELALPEHPLLAFELEQGDTLYIPRGFTHSAAAGDVTSVHLTVGIHPITWATLAVSMVESVIREDPRFRHALPPGFARDPARRAEALAQAQELFDQLHARLEPVHVIDQAAAEAERARPPELAGQFVDIVASHELTLETTLYRRASLRSDYRLGPERAELSFHAKTLRFPAHVDPCLRYILEREQLRGAELPNALDEAGKLVLVRRLLREGFLTTRPPDPT